MNKRSRKRTTRVISIIASLALVIGLLPVQAFSAEEPENLPSLGENIIVQGVVNYDKGTYYMNMQLLHAEIWTYD